MPFLLFLFLLFASSAYAQTPSEARQQLKGTLSEIKESNARAQKLEAKNAALAHEMKTLQESMVVLAKRTEAAENELSDAEEKLAILEQQRQQKVQALNARQGEISTAISAMIKLSQMPQEAIIAMPGKLDETLSTAQALSVVTHAVQKEADELKAQIRELDALADKVRHSRELVEAKKTALETEQQHIAEKVKERSRLQAELDTQTKQERERGRQLTEKSRDLEELVGTLERNERNRPWEHPLQKGTPQTNEAEEEEEPEENTAAVPHGHAHLPAAGTIVSHYGNPDAGAQFSKGILIETRAHAQVVAPYKGEVVFAGPFRDYGRIVIIRHGGDYHSLLSGMEQIDCTAGQFLLEGEPVGTMSGRSGTHRLYVELRKDGKPVDPLPWFKKG